MNGNHKQKFSNKVLNLVKSPGNLENRDSCKKFKKRPIEKYELELALTVILVDVASCDGNFEQSEYQIICSSLRTILGTSRTEMSKLINQAQLALGNLRGISRYAKLICDHLELRERQFIIEAVEKVIMADGREDGFETYMRHKLTELLAIQQK